MLPEALPRTPCKDVHSLRGFPVNEAEPTVQGRALDREAFDFREILSWTLVLNFPSSPNRRYFLQAQSNSWASARPPWHRCSIRTCLAQRKQAPNLLGKLPAFHHKPTAKRIIWLFMADAPSQLDLFDHKPELEQTFTARICPIRSARASGSRR